MSDYQVCFAEQKLGRVRLTQQGMYTVLDCVCPRVSDGILRLCWGEKPVGVLVPEGETLTLRRRLSAAERRALPEPGEDTFSLTGKPEREPEPEQAQPAMPAPMPKTQPEPSKPAWELWDGQEVLFHDRDLQRSVARARDVRISRRGETVYLSVPLRADRPFPMLPVFRYGECARVEGDSCLVFTIRDGELI